MQIEARILSFPSDYAAYKRAFEWSRAVPRWLKQANNTENETFDDWVDEQSKNVAVMLSVRGADVLLMTATPFLNQPLACNVHLYGERELLTLDLIGVGIENGLYLLRQARNVAWVEAHLPPRHKGLRKVLLRRNFQETRQGELIRTFTEV